MLRHYLLRGREAYQVHADLDDGSYVEWVKAWAALDRQVAIDRLPLAVVSTTFLGLDHNFWGEGPPLIFETMVFADKRLQGTMVGYQGRTSTWDEAEAMHAEVMKALLGAHQEAAG
jgi:hypothetical protein